MANEVLVRTPTSVGNRRVWTWSAWIKHNSISETGIPGIFSVQHSTGNQVNIGIGTTGGGYYSLTSRNSSEASNLFIAEEKQHKDYSSWINIVVSVDTTKEDAQNAVGIYVNGVKDNIRTDTFPGNSQNIPKNHQSMMNFIASHIIGQGIYFPFYTQMQMFDLFIVDGQALTPDVFGFYKSGKGYISSGSSVSTDFRPGQWVPKTPRIIRAEINRRGGFGVNGVYLPMNDGNNFGADFHGTPNSIIRLQENLPQPRCRIDGVGDYTGSLRDDPFKQNLVLAIPFVSGGLQNGFGDYSAAIRGSGTPKTITNSNTAISTFSSYYGSAGNFTSTSSSYMTTPRNISDYNMGSGDYTVEGWFYFKSINTAQWTRFFSIGNGSAGNEEGILFEIEQSTSRITFYSRDTNGNNLINGPVMIAGQWYHMALCRRSNIISAYINGVCVGTADCGTRAVNFTSNTALIIGAWENQIGSYTRFTDAYMQDLRVYKGVAKYTGGFDVPRPYSPIGVATWRAVPDTTANNFATMNPLIEARPSSGNNSPSNSSIVSFADGNLNLTNAASAGNAQRMVSFATIGISTGRWYWEVRADSNSRVGLSKGFQQLNYSGSALGSGSGLEATVTYQGDGAIAVNNGAFYSTATTTTGPSFSTTNIIGVAVDASNGVNNLTIQWFRDGVSVATLTGLGATSPVLEWFPTKGMMGSSSGNDQKFNFGQNPTFSGTITAGTFTDSNGKGLFKYQPPSGFLALCEDNLPKPTVEDPGKHFKPVLWTGNGDITRGISGVGFTPDLVWIKDRSVAYNHILIDSVRGATFNLHSNNTNSESTATADGVTFGTVSSFDTNGFSVLRGSTGAWTNQNNENYVAWCWKAGNTTQTNTSGSITSTVSVNQTAGFSIVSYTGNGTAGATVGHGLGKAPKFILIKRRSGASNWGVAGSILGANSTLYLNLTDAVETYTDTNLIRNIQTSTTFELGTDTNRNASGGTHIAYCWAEIEGFSKFGSYIGNGSADGPFVYTGGRPAFIMVKRTDSTGEWFIFDSSRNSSNSVSNFLQPNSANIEVDGGAGLYLDFLSNGFKWRSNAGALNASGGTYIFVAFAESPFQTANAK